jgi:hypothetical protein
LWIEQVLNAAITNGQLGNPAHVKLIKAVRPTKRRGERPRQFTAALDRTYRAAPSMSATNDALDPCFDGTQP